MTMRIRTFATTALLCVVTGALTGCGGSAAPSTTTQLPKDAATVHAQPARRTPVPSNPDVGTASAQHTHRTGTRPAPGAGAQRVSRSRDKVGPIRSQQAQPVGANDDNQASGSRALNPCTLVSLSQARSLTGGGVTGLTEAPLGPTCIYQRSGGHAPVTVAIQTQALASVKRQLRKPAAVVVHGHAGYCGQLGSQELFLALPAGQVLNVSAPCGVAQRFAALALSRLVA